jgi:hypothetical protein
MNAPTETEPLCEMSFELTDTQAMALAQFVKRIGWEEMRRCAVDDREAHVIKTALHEVQRELEYRGYAPR